MLLGSISILIFLLLVKSDMMTDVVLPSKCEVCKLLVTEILSRLQETKSSDALNLHSFQGDPMKLKYDTSELRLYEVLEDPPICNRLLQYKVHKERQDSTRFDKSMPQTMKSLSELVNRGVDVKLDVPFELWDKPSAEVTTLFKQCIPLVNEYQEIIEEWFYNNQNRNLYDYLCRENVLDESSQGCLDEKPVNQLKSSPALHSSEEL
ncbi:Protein canopy 4 isoform 1 [Schistosoma japonicum]|uniref:Protein canopy 4 isoform 1 n=1 Tax=Schistosoma japonicum TaxID=6182 RepID=A0A4Z2DCJ7_SCHJA|nr:Protein canopy 4 isoform 1 [Schistosoma japonicum]TNN14232.1 Protein canopy 4 isoform 1 [Schistosoma japonicum]